MSQAKKERLDSLLFVKGLAESRERAKTTIMSGLVYVDGQRADKPGMQVKPDCRIEVRGDPIGFVSRGGLKLKKALDAFEIHPEGLVCMDAGASTGGFTDCMLKNGAKKVYAVDVGYGQLAWSLRTDSRVVCMERTNVRLLKPEDIGEPIEFASADLSFISLRLILPVLHGLLKPDAPLVCLIKPQFEAGREQVGKKGVVREPAVHVRVLEDFFGYARDTGFSVKGLSFSPIKGPEGNIEYLAHLIRCAQSSDIRETVDVSQCQSVVEQAHSELG